MSDRAARRQRGFTLIELLVVIAVAGVLITIAAPSLRDFILMQRLKSVNAELVTDLAYARSEAVSRGQFVRLSFRSDDTRTCYTIFTSQFNSRRCDCRLGVGLACSTTAGTVEIRTVQVGKDESVFVEPPSGQTNAFAFDHTTGGIMSIPLDNPSQQLNSVAIRTYIDASRTIQTMVNRTGRTNVCAPDGSGMAFPAC